MIFNRHSLGSVAERKDVDEASKKDTGERSGKMSDQGSRDQRGGGGLVIRKLAQIRVERGKVKSG
jgi:hypothetical protein